AKRADLLVYGHLYKSAWVHLILPPGIMATNRIVLSNYLISQYDIHLKYSLHGKGANNIFTIDEERGNVFVQKALDREEHGLWRFVVLATDEEGEGLTGFADVIIYVVDINDNAPQFTCALSSCNANVYENAPPNTTVLEMTAVDADDKNEEINAILTYSMLNNTMNLFSINANTGTIYTLGNLDREKNDKYVLLVKVIDGGGLATTGTATISVLDINDHVPRFTQDSWNSVILETNDINTKVLEVSASDEDIGENALLTFSIIDGDPDQKFTIESDRMTNQAEIKLKKKLDYENPQERWFNLTIKVEDPDFSSLSFCFIELQDCNDNAPVFLAPFVQLSPVLENVTIGTVLTQVIASDADSGINGQIRYSIWPSSDVLGEFFVDPAGFVKVKKALDREVDSQYHLVILASDEGFPSQTGSATVSFSLLDVNDNGPVFDGLYTPVIWENTAWPQIVHMNESSDLLYASDYDTLENGPPFRFSLPSEYTNSTDFLLNDNGNNTATVHALRAFDREKDKEFYLPIIITDSGNPPMSATNMLLITIGDENDNPHRGGHKDVYINSYGGKVKHGTGRKNQGVYHVSAYNEELEDTRQNIFQYNEEGGGEEDQDAFNMTELQTRCSFTSGDFGQYFYDIFKDTTYLQQALSCDSLKIYDMEGDGSIASSLSTLASSGVEEDLVFEEIHDWGPKFGKLSKLYSYTEEDDLHIQSHPSPTCGAMSTYN
uniref:Cadherin domain-containing protein n=1 Tax=Xenopus tropicalis TaxID=8364 RepID=A0A6I8RFZ9_XENTR